MLYLCPTARRDVAEKYLQHPRQTVIMHIVCRKPGRVACGLCTLYRVTGGLGNCMEMEERRWG